MAKYIFLKDFTIRIPAGGGSGKSGDGEGDGKVTINFKKDEVVDGIFVESPTTTTQVGSNTGYVKINKNGEVRIGINPTANPNSQILKPTTETTAVTSASSIVVPTTLLPLSPNTWLWLSGIAGAVIFVVFARQVRPTAKVSTLAVVALLGALLGLGTVSAGDLIMKNIKTS